MCEGCEERPECAMAENGFCNECNLAMDAEDPKGIYRDHPMGETSSIVDTLESYGEDMYGDY